MNTNLLKFVGAVLLFGIWGIFAWMGKTPADGFITAVGAAISGLGIYHARSVPAASTDAVTPPQPGMPGTYQTAQLQPHSDAPAAPTPPAQ